MFTVIVSKTVADIICSESIYDLLIQFKGYPYLRKNIKVKGVAQDIMTSMDRLICIYEHEHDYHHVLEYPYKGYPVITRENHLVGYIERKWLESKEIDDLLSEDIKLHMMPACSVHPLTKTKIVFELFSRMGLGNIFVVQNGVLKGMITKKDVIYVSSL
jgi:chloride channel 3/4/5